MICKKFSQFATLSVLFALVSCQSDSNLKEKITKIIEENPEVVTKSIEKNPVKFVEAFQKAVKDAQSEMASKRDDEEKKEMEKLYDQPLTPKIRADETIRGTKGAPIVLVEYSDFQCPFCVRGFETVNSLLEQYKGKIQFIYKHLPLSFHQQAKLAAQYYEGIRLQNADKAFKFHDEVFKNQSKLQKGESFLKEIAKNVGADMGKLAKEVNSQAVLDRIEEDMTEAGEFGMQGTPGFLLNGIPVKGAYPKTHFDGIIAELQKRGKLKL